MSFDHRGLWSTMLGILGVILLYIGFSISKGTHLGEQIIIGILYFSAVLSLISAAVFGIKGVLEREEGFLKYIGILIIVILIFTITLWPFVFTLFV